MSYVYTIKELIDKVCNNYCDREAFIFKNGKEYEHKTYTNFQNDCYHASKVLIQQGVTGKHIALLVKTSYTGLIALFSTIVSTNTAVIPDHNYSCDILEEYFTKTDADVLLYDEEFKDKAIDVLHTSQSIRTIISIQEILSQSCNASVELLPQSPDQDAIILFTSGTTGSSKAVVLTNENICANACASAENYGADEVALTHGNTSIAILPIHHAMFLVFVTTLMQEAIAIYFNTNISTLMEDMKRIKPCTMTIIPVLVEQIYNEVMKIANENPNVLKSKILRHVTGGRLYGMSCGSAKLNPKYIKAFWDWGIVISEGYGMTEASPSISSNNYNNFKMGSVGKPLPGVEVKIVDGEIWTRSKCVMKGYYKDEASTKEVLEDGWLKTGDLGYLDEEGFLFITGRKKNLIILSNGENVSPEELETLISHEEFITEGIVYEWNGVIAAELYIKNWEEYSVEVLWAHTKSCINNVNRQLPVYKKIQTFLIRKVPFERNRMKKLMRNDIRMSEYINPPAIENREPKTEMEKKVADIFKAELQLEHILVSDKFFEIGGNSLLARRVANEIEENLHIKIAINDIFEHPTVLELAEFLEMLAPSEYLNMEHAEQKDCYKMSALQRRIFMIYQEKTDSLAYNIPVFCKLDRMPDVEKFEWAIREITKRHEIMRTTFHSENGAYIQKVHEEALIEFKYEETDLEFKELAKQFVKPFCLQMAPLFRTKIVKNRGDIYLLFDIHHIISDGTSIFLFFKELSCLYSGIEVFDVKMQYKDYSEWLHQDGMKKIQTQKEYWLERFEGEVPVLDMPLDYARQQNKSTEGSSKTYHVDSILANRINNYCLTSGHTLFSFLLSSLMCVISKYTRQEDIVIGTPVAGRTRAETQDMLGMFVNTLALREYPLQDKSYRDFLQEVKDDYIKALDCQDYPFDDLVEELHINWDATRNPLFDIMFVLQNEEAPQANIGDIKLDFIQQESQSAQFDLSVDVREVNGELWITWEYRKDLFAESTIDYLQMHWNVFFENVLYDDTKKIGEISLVSESEKEKLLETFSGELEKEIPVDTIVALFEQQVEKNPEAKAVVYRDTSLTYKELNERANQVANRLKHMGIKTGDFVVLIAEKSLEMLIAIYGILKSGGCYVPMDPAYPKDRLCYMLEDCNPKVIVAYYSDKENEAYHDSLFILEEYRSAEKKAEVLDLSYAELQEESIEDVVSCIGGNDLAYVIYTSGTTGQPKGVLIEHKGLVNLSVSFNQAYQMRTEDRILQFASFCFDQSVCDIFSVLPTQSAVCMIPEEIRREPDKLVEYIKDTKVTILPLTPSYINLLEPSSMPTVRLIDAGGEVANLEVLKHWVRVGKEAINSYGPTEVTVNSSYCYIREDTKVLTIGKPLDNINIFIMNGKNLCGIGVPGELCITGVGLARGYLNKQDLTDEKFTTNPYGESRMYRTGDLARWLPDGTIDFLGRIDDQVKIRGYRVELGEISNTLLSLPEIKDAAVIAFGEGQDKELCAYYVSESELDIGILRSELGRHLISYMIPNYFVHMEQLPLTSSGKINRKALPKPDESTRFKTEYIAPRNDAEKIICKIFANLFHMNRVSVIDSFFDLGGHSLSAIAIEGEMKEHFPEYQLRDIFTYTTAEKLAEFLTGEKVSDVVVKEVSESDEINESDEVRNDASFPTTYPEDAHVLPIKYPSITSLTFHAHLLSILETEDKTKEWLYSNYIQIFCNKKICTNYYADFYFPMIDIVRPAENCPWIRHQRISVETLEHQKIDILDFICNQIDLNYYVNITVDFYYVKESQAYHWEHTPHDMLIYGYHKKKEIFYCTDFVFHESGRYANAEVTFSEFKKAYEEVDNKGIFNYMKGQILLYQLKDKEDVKFNFNVKNIRNSLFNYYQSKLPEYWDMFQDFEKPEIAVGMDVYQELIDYVEYSRTNSDENMDIREYYIMQDHKKMMQKRLDYLCKNDILRRENYQKLEKSNQIVLEYMNQVVMLIIKYNYEKESSILDEIINLLIRAREIESKAFTTFLDEVKY